MTTRFAIVDGYSTGRYLVWMLSGSGAECVHVESQPDMPAALTGGHDRTDYIADIGYRTTPAAAAAAIAPYGVSAVVAGTESGVCLADWLNELLGTPGNDMETADARRHKTRMAEVLGTAGIAVPAGSQVTSAEDAVRWCADNDVTEAVAKPVDSAGTDNVRICQGPAEVAAAVTKILASSNIYGAPNRSALVQCRVIGPEYKVNSVSCRGSHRIPEVWQYTKRVGPEGAPLYDFEEPVSAASAEFVLLSDFVRRALDALGIRHGAAHSEIILSQGGPVLIETGARLGGAELPWIVDKVLGMSQARLLANTLLDPDGFGAWDEPAVAWTQHVRSVSFINRVAGVVRSNDWARRIKRLPSCVAVVPTAPVGHDLPLTTDLTTAPGYAYFASSDPEEIRQDYSTLREWEECGLYTS